MRFALAAAVAFLLCNGAQAGTRYSFDKCAEHEFAVAYLKNKFDETAVGSGLQVATENEIVSIELFVSPSGSWTMLYSRPNGRSCILAGGTDWGATALPDKPAY